MQDISKNTVYSPHWQFFRVRMLGFWNEDIQRNINLCEQYLGKKPNASQLYRVLNMLNAVRMGFHGMGIVDSTNDKALVEYRDKVKAAYDELRAAGEELEEVSEERVREEWLEVPQYYKELIVNDLTIRYIKSSKSPNREDLKWFLNIVGAKI